MDNDCEEQEPVFGEVLATDVANVLRARGVDAATVEFCFDDWDHCTGFIARNGRGVAIGEGSVLVVCDHDPDRIFIKIHIGDVRPL